VYYHSLFILHIIQ